MRKKLLTGLLCTVLLFNSINITELQVFASEMEQQEYETEMSTGGGYETEAYAESDEDEAFLEDLSDLENLESETRGSAEEAVTIDTEASETESEETSEKEETSVNDNETKVQEENSEETSVERETKQSETNLELTDSENKDNATAEYKKGMPYSEVDGEYQYDMSIPHIIINQVYGDGAKKDVCVSHDFIELYNPTDSNVDLSEWSVQYRSSVEGGTESWAMHELSGTIKAHCSYLIRCGENSKLASEYVEITNYDEEWNQQFFNKGLSVVLLASKTEIDSSSVVFDNENGQPALGGYVDMFAVSGEDGFDSQKALYYETAVSAVQSKNKTARRDGFSDTDDNSVNGDFEKVDYSFENADYIKWISPRSSKDGEWDEEKNARPTFTVTYESNGGNEIEQETYGLGMEITEPQKPVKEGYMFAGWYEDESLTKQYVFSTTWPTGDIILYADWTEGEWVDVNIDNAVLKAGNTVKVNNVGGYALKFYVDEEYVSDNSYVLETADYEKWIKVEAYNEETLVGEDEVYFSKLPVMYIDTDDGEGITSKKEYKTSNMLLQGNNIFESANYLYNGGMQVKGRGNATWLKAKKPYRIKLDKKADLLNMGSNKNWVLLANYWDSSLIKNKLAYDFSGKIGLNYMQSEPISLVLNGEYRGNYLLCEQIRIDTNRIDIFDWEALGEDIAIEISGTNSFSKDKTDDLIDAMQVDLSWIDSGKIEYDEVVYSISDYYKGDIPNASGGYLIEFDGYYDEISKFKANDEIPTMIKSPEYLCTSNESMEFLQSYIEKFDDALHSSDFYTDDKDISKHYSEYVDFDSLVRYWLVSELFYNLEGQFKSKYAYMDIDGLLVMEPLWDMDTSMGWCTDNDDSYAEYYSWRSTRGGMRWDLKLTSDPYFVIKSQEQYWKYRKYIEELIEKNGEIDSLVEYIYKSGEKNFDIWGNGVGANHYFEINSYEDSVTSVKWWLSHRIDWLDTQFETETSIIKSLKNYSSSSKFKITLTNTNTDTGSEHAAAQGILTDNELTLNVNLLSEDIEELRIFINGLKYKNVTVDETDKDSVKIVIPAAALTEASGDKNVITIYSVGADGEYSGSNFTTVIKMDYEEYENILCKGTPYILAGNTLSYNVDVPHIIINQMYGADNDGYCSHSFIELYNPTDEEVRLNGWALYYQSAPGGKYNGTWEKLELQGTINAHSSYLVRCKQVTKPENVVYEVPEGDLEWSDLRMYNKGGTVLLSYMHDDIPGSDRIYDNDDKTPLIKGYVDMLSVSGNDTDTPENIAKEAAPHSEGTASQLQSKKKAIRRTAFTDTDNNSAENGDCEIIDYTFGASQYIDWVAPRNSASGEWYASDVPKYTVTLNMNDGTDASETVEITYTNKVTGLTDPEREGHTFKGWYTEPECETEYDFAKTPTADVALYAGWDINVYTVRFSVDGDADYAVSKADYGTKVTEPDVPTKLGHTFKGWYTDDKCSNKYDFDSEIRSDLTLNAGWEINKYTVTFMSDVDNEYDRQTVEYNNKASKPELPSKTGYSFTGWYAGEELYDFDMPVKGDLTLNAGWEINKYTVTFMSDVDNEYDRQTVEYNNKASKPELPSKTGYNFTGWYNGEELYDFDMPVEGDLTLYAGWDTELQSVSIEGITDENLLQSVDTINEYKIQLQPENMPYSVIAMETDGSSGIKAELDNDTLKINTVDAAAGDSLSVKFYNTVISTDSERVYINGGSFTITAAKPSMLMNSVPWVSVKGTDDVSVTLCVSMPQKIEKFVKGKLYYKLEAVPYADGQGNIPDEIRSAAAHPVYAEVNEETWQIELIVNDAGYGKGQAWKYDIKVSLLLVMDGILPDDLDFTDKIFCASKENCLTAVETRKNSADNKNISFDLQDRNTIIYTGQSALVAADVLWNESHIIDELGEVRDITALGRGTSGGRLTVSEADGKIMISAPKGTEPGVHTIEAVSYGPDKVYKVRKTMSVTVLKGIETLKVNVPSTRIYKQSGKEVKINAALSFNDGGTEPKLKRVTWQITDADGNLLNNSSPLHDMIKISDGKLVIDKRLALAKESDKNCFRIMARADDYSGNETYALSDVIEISDSKAVIGNIVLLRYNSEDETYETIDVDKQLTADTIDKAIVVSLKAGSPDKQVYTPDEIQKYQVPCGAVQYKSSNGNLTIEITDGGAVLNAGQVTGKVTLTATTADGGKQKALLKLNLTYAKPTELAVAILDKNGTAFEAVDAKDVSFAGTTNTVINLQVNAKASSESQWEPLWAYTNYALKVKGGKILESDSLKGLYDIVVTGEKATVTLTDKTNKATKTYTLTNYAFSKQAAPKVRQEGILAAGSLKDRSITFKLSGKYDYAGKSVMIETDATQKTSKNKKAYQYTSLEKASLSFGECSMVAPDGTITVSFDSTFIYASNYKLKLTFGVVDANGVFIADAKPVSQTLKVKAAKAVKGSFKPATSYKMKASAGATVLLTGTGKEIRAYDTKNLANVTGKGTENKFTDYFEIRDNQLCLKADLSGSDMAYLKSREGKKDLTGYVTYTAYHGDNGYGEPYVTAKTVKITVKLTDS